MSERVAIVAAMKREVAPFVEGAQAASRRHEGREYRFYQRDDVTIVCGGIGAAAASMAARAVIAESRPALLVSAGFTGATGAQAVGSIIVPAAVIDASSGERFCTSSGSGVLVTCAAVLGAEEKASIKSQFDADAIDMEAAGVARVAREQRIDFMAVKAVSDAAGFRMPPVGRFVSKDGRFQMVHFVAFSAVRPWLWPAIRRLNRNSAAATKSLCFYLESLCQAGWRRERQQGEVAGAKRRSQ